MGGEQSTEGTEPTVSHGGSKDQRTNGENATGCDERPTQAADESSVVKPLAPGPLDRNCDTAVLIHPIFVGFVLSRETRELRPLVAGFTPRKGSYRKGKAITLSD
jgi:hypothetical protein